MPDFERITLEVSGRSGVVPNCQIVSQTLDQDLERELSPALSGDSGIRVQCNPSNRVVAYQRHNRGLSGRSDTTSDSYIEDRLR